MHLPKVAASLIALISSDDHALSKLGKINKLAAASWTEGEKTFLLAGPEEADFLQKYLYKAGHDLVGFRSFLVYTASAMASGKTESKRMRVQEKPAALKTARQEVANWKSLTFGALFLFLLTLVVYSPVIRGGFLWDDLPAFIERPFVASESGFEMIWFKIPWIEFEFLPMTVTTFWLEHRLWGKNPMGYHITNIVLHALGSALLWRLLLRLKLRGAFLIALTFAVHPVCVSSVAWIAERKNTLSLVFFLLSLLLFVRSEETEVRNSGTGFRVSPISPRLLYFGSLIAFLLALLSKTSITPLPVVLLVLAFWQRGGIAMRDLLRSVPFFLLSIGFGLLTIYSQSNHAIRGEVVQTETFAARLAESAWAVWFYLWKILVPLNLSAIYPRWELQKIAPIHFVPLVALAGFLFWFWWKRKTWGRHALFAFGFFVILLLPVLGFIDMYFLTFSRVADHWQYVPLIGILAFTVGGSVWLLENKFSASRQIKRFSAVALIAFLSVLTWNRAKVHASEESLWSDVVKKNPKAWIAYTHLGKVRHEQGRSDEAIALFDHSLSLKADYAETHNRKGVVLAANGNLPEAIECFATALRLAPGHAEAHRNLGAALTTTGDFLNAVKHLREYCRFQPNSIDAASSLAWILATHPDPNVRNGSEAVELAKRALEQMTRPDANALETLAAAYAEAGDFANAQKVAQSGIALAKAVPDEPLAARIEFELNGYQANQPFRDPSFGGN